MKTSIQYQLTNVKLFNDIYGDYKNFIYDLDEGPEYLKKRLLNEWYKIKEKLSGKDVEVVDIDREVSLDDFDVKYEKLTNGTQVFYFIFPDFDFGMSACKYVALVMEDDYIPRYITFEESIGIDNEIRYAIGEWKLNENDEVVHVNHGFIEPENLFEDFVMNVRLMFDVNYQNNYVLDVFREVLEEEK